MSRNSVPSLKQAIFLFYFNVISGCDDLLPILSFVIIRSGMAQLVSECDAMEEFIPEGLVLNINFGLLTKRGCSPRSLFLRVYGPGARFSKDPVT